MSKVEDVIRELDLRILNAAYKELEDTSIQEVAVALIKVTKLIVTMACNGDDKIQRIMEQVIKPCEVSES